MNHQSSLRSMDIASMTYPSLIYSKVKLNAPTWDGELSVSRLEAGPPPPHTFSYEFTLESEMVSEFEAMTRQREERERERSERLEKQRQEQRVQEQLRREQEEQTERERATEERKRQEAKQKTKEEFHKITGMELQRCEEYLARFDNDLVTAVRHFFENPDSTANPSSTAAASSHAARSVQAPAALSPPASVPGKPYQSPTNAAFCNLRITLPDHRVMMLQFRQDDTLWAVFAYIGQVLQSSAFTLRSSISKRAYNDAELNLTLLQAGFGTQGEVVVERL